MLWWKSTWEKRYHAETKRYLDERLRALYWQGQANSYRVMALQALRNQQAPERGVRRLVNKVKRLQLELKRLKESEVSTGQIK